MAPRQPRRKSRPYHLRTPILPDAVNLLNYRHRFHAGNAADVFKHIVLLEIVAALKAKPTPFFVLDTHAGAGRYTLKTPGEHEDGIGRLWEAREQLPAAADYFDALKTLNPRSRLVEYPGSPLLVAHALRPQDRAILTELHPEEHSTLRANLRAFPNTAVHLQDATQALKAFLPPRENRGLVLIDPPYEQRDELEQLPSLLSTALTRWRNGIFALWYPIKTRGPVERFKAALARLDAPWLAIEFMTLPEDAPIRLNGSGMAVFNPPWKLAEQLRTILPPVAARLCAQGAGGVRFSEE